MPVVVEKKTGFIQKWSSLTDGFFLQKFQFAKFALKAAKLQNTNKPFSVHCKIYVIYVVCEY